MNTADNHSKLVRTEAVLNQTISTVSPIASDVNFVVAKNETEENPTKINTGAMTNKTSGKIKGSTQSTDDVLTQSFTTNTSVDSLNATTNLTNNSSEKTIESSPVQNFNLSITNTNTEDNLNNTNDQMRLRICPLRRYNQLVSTYIYWCLHHGLQIITLEHDPRDLIMSITNTNTEDTFNHTNDQIRIIICPLRRYYQSIRQYYNWCAKHGLLVITLELDPGDLIKIMQLPGNKPDEEPLGNQTWAQQELRNQTKEEKRKEEKRRYYLKISSLMWKSIPPVIIVVGTVGNTLSILVMLRKRFRHTTMCFYLIALAVADTFVLYCSLLPLCLEAYLSTEFNLHSDFLCKTLKFLSYYGTHIASWIIVCLTSERFVAVSFPHYCKILFTQARAAIALAFIIFILLVFDMHFFWTHHLQEYTRQYHYIDLQTTTIITHTKKVCSINNHIKQHVDFKANVWPWMDITLFSLLPFVFIVVGNITICIKLGLARFNRRNLGASTNQSQNQSKLISTAVVLGSVSLLFILSTLPVTVLHFSYKPRTTPDTVAFAKEEITKTTLVLLQYLNNAFNFVLYCLSGRQFRKELIIMLTRNRSRVHPIGGQQHRGDNIQMTGTSRNVTENSRRTTNTNV